jgi:hypothetical protein
MDWFTREHERQQSPPRTPENDLRLYADQIAQRLHAWNRQ